MRFYVDPQVLAREAVGNSETRDSIRSACSDLNVANILHVTYQQHLKFCHGEYSQFQNRFMRELEHCGDKRYTTPLCTLLAPESPE